MREHGVSGRLLWDVDTQVDFVHADGKLPVPDAESAAPAMATARPLGRGRTA